jgi:hypothetical protein
MESQALPVLRPLRLGELLDQAIRLYRQNFVTFIGIVALVYVPLMVLQTAATTLTSTSMVNSISEYTSPQQLFSNYAYWAGILSSLVILALQIIFVQGIATGALTRAVADKLFGRPTSILDAYRDIGKSWMTLLGALLFIGVLVIVLSIWWAVVPCLGWFTGLGMLAFLGAAIAPMTVPVVVVEQPGPWSVSTDTILDRFGKFVLRTMNSVQRAWYLVRRRFWPVLGTIFILYLFNLLIVNGPSAIVNAILVSVTPRLDNATLQVVVTAIVQALVSIVFILIYYPLQMTAFTLIYFDLRVRTEGFDLALLASGNAEQAIAAPAPQTKESLVTGTDLGNFAILTLGAVGIYIFLFAFVFGGLFFLGNLFN